MPCYFSDESLREIKRGYDETLAAKERVQTAIFSHQYVSHDSREYALHGLLRRSNLLVHAMERVFEAIPPERAEAPSREELLDATIALHAFTFNVFGYLDNLAWLWVTERDLKLDKMKVGLKASNREVRASFSKTLNLYLHNIEPWFTHIVGFRNALAHRIPLYIPPFVIHPDKKMLYDALEAASTEAIACKDVLEFDRLQYQQSALGSFQPLMTYTTDKGPSRPIIFHGQIVCDYATIAELTLKMLDELSSI